jgi:hypothetical protein
MYDNGEFADSVMKISARPEPNGYRPLFTG